MSIKLLSSIYFNNITTKGVFKTMEKNLTTIINTNTRTDIIPVDKETFMVAPTHMNLPLIYVTSVGTDILVSEEDLSKKELLLEVFDENSEFSSGIQKFSSKDEVFMDLVEKDPTILSELYVLFEEQHNANSDELWKIVKSLINDFSPDIVVTKLIAATIEEMESLINEKDPLTRKTMFVEL